jgi:hypothetical protein
LVLGLDLPFPGFPFGLPFGFGLLTMSVLPPATAEKLRYAGHYITRRILVALLFYTTGEAAFPATYGGHLHRCG